MSVLCAPYMHNEAAAFVHVEAMLWPEGPVCPHCGVVDRAYRLEGVRTKPSAKNPEGKERHGLWKCRECRKQFTVRKGTIFEESHLPLHFWLQAIHLMASSKKGISSHQLHRVLGITYKSAKSSISRIQEFRAPPPLAHREIGSLEGFVAKVELDGFQRPIVWLRSRLDGQIVKCVASDGGLDRIGHFEVMEVLKGKRVRVHGLLHYKSLEQIASIEVEGVHVFEADTELPDAASVVSPGFTGGVESSAYLEALRQDG